VTLLLRFNRGAADAWAVAVLLVLAVGACSLRLCWLLATHAERDDRQ
jgi:hypothetical protein